MTTQARLTELLLAAGDHVGVHELIEEKLPSGQTAWHVRWPCEHGTLACRSIGGQGFTRYDWSFEPKGK